VLEACGAGVNSTGETLPGIVKPPLDAIGFGPLAIVAAGGIANAGGVGLVAAGAFAGEPGNG